jgi:ATP-dependent DNA helicase RecG
MPTITNIDLLQSRVVSRAYLNNRIGDFLKELDLIEGKSTGLPIIRDAMAATGNPEPIFFTDEGLVLFMVTLPCHPELIVTKSVPKSVPKISREEVDQAFF